MKRKILTVLVMIIAPLACVLCLSACATKPDGAGNGIDHTHSYANYVYNNDATCGKDGTETGKCLYCDNTDTRTKKNTATGAHQFGDDNICDICGYNKGNNNNPSDNTHTHSYGNYEYNNDATCGNDGTETGRCLYCDETDTRTKSNTATGAHQFSDDNICDVCGYNKGNTEHTHTLNYFVGQVATCTENGNIENWQCKDCKKYFSDRNGAHEIYNTVIQKLGHDTVTHAAQTATCTEKGWNAYVTCSRCDYTTYNEVAALGHNEQSHSAQAATCTEKGWNAYATCSRCDYSTYSEIKALGHDIKMRDAQAATCTEDGWGAYEFCNRCDYTTIVPISAVGHIETSLGILKEATCSEAGETGGTICSLCGEVIEGKGYINALHVLYTYNSNYDGYVVTGVKSNCSHEEIAIPNEYFGKSVVSIGDSAFSGNTKVHTVILPDSLMIIGKEAFCQCTTLTEINIPNSLLSIGNRAFAMCSSITNITIPDSVLSVGGSVFYNCTKLTSVHIGTGISELPSCERTEKVGSDTYNIHEGFFESCSSLMTINIPLNIRNLGEKAFAYCSSLSQIDIPDSVINVGGGVFYNCSQLASVTLGANVNELPCLSFRESKLSSYIKNYGFFENCSLLNSVESTNNLTAIGARAFYDCSEIDNFSFPESLNEIGGLAFYNCKLSSIVLQQGVTWVGADAFRNCPIVYAEIPTFALATIPKDLLQTLKIISGTSIANSALSNAATLTSVEMADSVTTIGRLAFDNCTMLSNVKLSESLELIGELAFYRCYKLKEVCIPNSVTTISKSAFSNCSSLEKITLPFVGYQRNGTTNTNFGYIFGDGVSYNKNSDVPTSIKTVELTDSTTIDSNAFSNCESIENITLNDGLISIGSFAFSSCTSLLEILIPATVNDLGIGFISACSNVNKLTVTADNETFYDTENCIIEYASGTLVAGCYTSIIPTDGSITGIGERAFSVCTLLKEVIIPNGVISIGSYAFYGCSSLTQISVPDGMQTMGDQAFSSCTELKELIIPDSVTEIGAELLYGCSKLTNVVLGNGITNIPVVEIKLGSTTYYYGILGSCNSLESITIPFVGSSLDGMGYTNFGCLFGAKSYAFHATYVPKTILTVIITGGTQIPHQSFRDCRSIVRIDIPDSVTYIKGAAFEDCENLLEIDFPEGQTMIEGSTFWGCKALKTIQIPNSVTSIANNAFYGCTSLNNITIPAAINSIGYNSFIGCSSLKQVTFENTVGWWVSEKSNATSGRALGSANLQNTSTAAKYLTSTAYYANYYWFRSE